MPEQDQTTGADWSEDAPAAGQPALAPEQAPDNAQAPTPVPEQPAAEQPAAEQPAPAPAPEPPAPVLEEPAKPTLPPNPVASLRQVFREVAVLVGEAKASFILAEFYGAASPDALRAAELLDAIDKLYEAA